MEPIHHILIFLELDKTGLVNREKIVTFPEIYAHMDKIRLWAMLCFTYTKDRYMRKKILERPGGCCGSD